MHMHTRLISDTRCVGLHKGSSLSFVPTCGLPLLPLFMRGVNVPRVEDAGGNLAQVNQTPLEGLRTGGYITNHVSEW